MDETASAVIDPAAEFRPMELTLADALSVAVQLHRAGEIDDAEELYRRILEVAPEQPDALHFLGILKLYRGRPDEAIDLVTRSIEIDSSYADRYSNLGNVLLAARRRDEAVEAYRKALELDPAHATAWTNLGAALVLLRRPAEAAEAYEKALAADPKHIDAYNNYGNLLTGQGHFARGLNCYTQALALKPLDTHLSMLVGLAHGRLGQTEKAAEIFRRWLEQEPDNPVPKHLLAGCSGTDVPERAPDDYVERNFDGFADSFDMCLAILDYRAPQLVSDALARGHLARENRWNVLDLGCGTGLCGAFLKPYSQRLVGVDLSGEMLKKAQARRLYDALVKSELTAFVEGERAAYDIIVSADTLVYFGALERVAKAACIAARRDALLVFTIEAATEECAPAGYRIHPHGRYSHTRSYVERVLRDAGFGQVAMEPSMLRMEGGLPVDGWLVTARKGPRA